jgi:hypothetical protein
MPLLYTAFPFSCECNNDTDIENILLFFFDHNTKLLNLLNRHRISFPEDHQSTAHGKFIFVGLNIVVTFENELMMSPCLFNLSTTSGRRMRSGGKTPSFFTSDSRSGHFLLRNRESRFFLILKNGLWNKASADVLI